MRRFLIGIAGGSGSGKTTLARALQARFAPHELLVISLDGYYRDRSDLTLPERRALNFDHPGSLDEALLRDHLAALKAGQPIEQPLYDYTTHARSGTSHTASAPVILLEGILALSLATVRELLDLKIFVETPADLRVLRRLRRDVAERGRTVESVMDQYMESVRPMHDAFIEPSRHQADLILPGEGRFEVALDVLRAWGASLLR